MRVLLIRHGQTQGNVSRRYIGQKTDEELLKTEKERALLAGNSLCSFLPEDFPVYCSPMRRCIRTAELLFAGKTPVICPGFTEIDFGLFEGKNYAELLADPKLGGLYQAWIDSGGTLPFPEGESRADLEARSLAEFRRVIRETMERSKSSEDSFAAIVCHGGTIMSIMSSLTGEDYYDFMIANLDGYELELEVREEEIHVLSYCRLSERLSA